MAFNKYELLGTAKNRHSDHGTFNISLFIACRNNDRNLEFLLPVGHWPGNNKIYQSQVIDQGQIYQKLVENEIEDRGIYLGSNNFL